jgi:hypothetical protein
MMINLLLRIIAVMMVLQMDYSLALHLMVLLKELLERGVSDLLPKRASKVVDVVVIKGYFLQY